MARRANRTPKKRSAPDWAPKLLKKLAETANIKASCKVVKIGRMTFYDRRNSDPVFAAAVKVALTNATDDLELEARRRAQKGTDKPVYYKGEQCGTVREYSDTLLIFLLKAHRPKKYRESVKHTGADGGPIQHEHAIATAGLDLLATQLRKVLDQRGSETGTSSGGGPTSDPEE